MYQYKGENDTIAAISTAMGQGGIGIVRLSGAQSIELAQKIFQSKSSLKLTEAKSHSIFYGWIKSQDGKIVDEVLLSLMRGPNSYTKEDIVEINCHGSIASLKSILAICLEQGARLAEAGEFTKRAFLNGRIDLTQAEAVLDIIQSKTDTFLRLSANQLKGQLSVELAKIREDLMSVYVELEAIVNFPEDEIDSEGRQKISKDIMQQAQCVKRLVDTGEQGRILKEGIKIVLCGKPNVGKSSLLNELLKTPRAIVSDIAGTTRDTIEETAQIRGIPFQLIDTAGILEPRDLIEEEAVKRSRMYMQNADLVLLVIDASQPINDEDKKIISVLKDQNVLVVFNKNDLKRNFDEKQMKGMLQNYRSVEISALKKEGIHKLEEAIVSEVLHDKKIDTQDLLISNIRHIDALNKCFETLDQARINIVEGLSFEFISEDIKAAVNYLDSITGRNIDTDLLDTIFSQFCIGK